MPIAESELILNSRGAIYHLNLLPDELADTVILVGDPDRVEKVSRYFDNIECKQQHREFISHTGRVGQQRITVLSTGIGPDNIDIALNELDALANIDFQTRNIKAQLKSLRVIRFGTSGALQGDIPTDSLVASTHGIGLDNLMHYYQYNKTPEEAALASSFAAQTGLDPAIHQPYAFAGSPSLLNLFQQGFFQGITVTCPGFYGPQGRILRLNPAKPDLIDRLTDCRFGNNRITNFEMETSAIFGMCRLLGHEAMSLNVIVANRIQKTFSKNSEAAVDHMIRHALQALTAS